MNDIKEEKKTKNISKFWLFNYRLSIFSAILFFICLVSSIRMGTILCLLSSFILLVNGFYLTFSGAIVLILLMVKESSEKLDKKHALTSMIVGIILFSIELFTFLVFLTFEPY